MKKILISIIALVVGFSSQPVNAINVSDALPGVPLIPEVDMTFRDTDDFLQLEDGTLLVFAEEYVSWEERVKTLIYSKDAGKTWSEPFELSRIGSVANFVNRTPLGGNKFLMTYPTGQQAGEPVVSRIVTVAESGVTMTDPVTIHDNNDQTMRYSAFAGISVVKTGNLIRTFVVTADYVNGDNPNSILEYQSTDGGLTWSIGTNPFSMDDGFDYWEIRAVALADGNCVIVVSGSLKGTNNYYTIVKKLDGDSWDLIYSSEVRGAVSWVEVINEGQGIAIPGTASGSTPFVLIWPTLTSRVIDYRPTTIGNARIPEVESDGKSMIVLSYHQQENMNGYGAKEVVTEVSTDLGQTWNKYSHVALPAETAPQDWRLYGGFSMVNPEGEIIRVYQETVAGLEGYHSWLISSEDSGATWSEPYKLIDGVIYDSWNEKYIWNAGEAPKLLVTRAWDLVNNYNFVPVLYTWENKLMFPEKLGFKAQFKYGAEYLSSLQKKSLKAWAAQIPAGTQVKVTAPNFEKPNAKAKKVRSLKRANQIATILRNSGLVVKVKAGKFVKWVDPAKGRLVKVRIIKTVN